MNSLYEYEKTLSKEKKKKCGIVYTPKHIVDYINGKCLELWNKPVPPKVIDFSAGTGVFLVDMCEKISVRYNITKEEVYEKFIFANDLDEDAINIFHEFTKCPNYTIGDGLKVDLSAYDIIVGNPPYVKIQHLSAEIQKMIREFSWCEFGNTDLYIAMAEKFHNSGKIFGFISPNSWIKSSTGSKMVESVLSNRKITELIDFRGKKVFKAAAYCSIMIGNNQNNSVFDFKTDLDSNVESKSFFCVEKDNFFLYKDEVSFIKDVQFKTNKLADFCSLRVGLATLADSVYFMKDCTVSNGLVTSGSLSVEEGITKKCYKAGRLSRYADKSKKKIPIDRIIYPYDANKKPLEESVLSQRYPKAYAYLLANKKKLLARDKKGVAKRVKEDKMKWYEYGRTQGMSLKDEKILMSPIVSSKILNICMHIKDGLFISGYCLEMKSGKKIKDIIKIVKSENFQRWIKIFGAAKSGGYYSINKKCVESFKF